MGFLTECLLENKGTVLLWCRWSIGNFPAGTVGTFLKQKCPVSRQKAIGEHCG